MHRLGDPEWLGTAVAKPAPKPRRTIHPDCRVGQVIEALGT
ncbi:hypothetical protein [Streptomyces sp. NPDC000410]